MSHPETDLASASASTSASNSNPPPPLPPPPPSSARPAVRARPVRLTSSGSFHAGAPLPSFPSSYGANPGRKRLTVAGMRRVSTHMYHTFPTQPPKTPSDTADVNPYADYSDARGRGHRHAGSRDSANTDRNVTPLPVRQLVLLALLSICEQTALNSIGPYLPTMVASFPEIPEGQTGLYVGLLASSFALAQLTTNFLWGYFSDRIGRKPIMLLGTAMLMACFLFFGFCVKYWQVLVVHVAMGLLNGNAAVVPTVLGEVTDRSNQSKAFTWLPVMYSLGGITGPALGGLLVGRVGDDKYPFLGPNIMSAAFLLVAVLVLAIWFEETLENVDGQRLPNGLQWTKKSWSSVGRSDANKTFWNPLGLHWHRGHAHHYDQGDNAFNERSDAGQEDQALLRPQYRHHIESSDHGSDDGYDKDNRSFDRSTLRQLLNWTTISILITYLIFQIANIAFNSLYPIFASAPSPTGRELQPVTIGVCMSVAGIITILFQILLFEAVKARLGNLGTFRLGLLGLALTMILMPWVGHQDDRGLFGWGDGRSWLLGELSVILVLKNLSAVGGLSCVLLLITNSAPSHETLGALNGLAQSLSAAGRSFGPFASGALFTLSTRIQPKGEVLAWGLFGGVALIGWVWSLTVNGSKLESDDYTGDGHEHDDREGDESCGHSSTVPEEEEDLEDQRSHQRSASRNKANGNGS